MKFTSEEFDKILSEPYPTGTVFILTPKMMSRWVEILKDTEILDLPDDINLDYVDDTYER